MEIVQCLSVISISNRGIYVLRRIAQDHAHFLLLTFWDSVAAIQQFAGADIDKAKYYPEDTQYLLELEPTVTHYEVLETPRSISQATKLRKGANQHDSIQKP